MKRAFGFRAHVDTGRRLWLPHTLRYGGRGLAGWLAQYNKHRKEFGGPLFAVCGLARGSIMDVRAHADIAPADQVGRQEKNTKLLFIEHDIYNLIHISCDAELKIMCDTSWSRTRSLAGI